ncbi:MAG: peptidase [Flavisolibacter sp.]|jgi:hypothetical protein|nr:peptidase [Flavisolibacter sp.]
MRSKFITLVLLLFAIAFAVTAFFYMKAERRFTALHFPKKPTVTTTAPKTILKIQTKVSEAMAFVNKNKYNNELCFLIDLNLPSNQKRFFIYDFKKNRVSNSGLVTHGNCNETWLEGRRYGNITGCGCSSVGKYKIGYAYYGKFGLAFKLHGLEATNDRAMERYVVLHSHGCVPDTEVVNDICQSNGCPTVSPKFLKEIEPLIIGSKKPILLWILD